MAAAWHAHVPADERWVRPRGWATRVAVLSAGATIFGSAATLANHTVYQIPAVHTKTLTNCLPAAAAMALNLILHWMMQWRASRRPRRTPRRMATSPVSDDPLLGSDGKPWRKPLFHRWHLLFLPAMLDLATTVLLNLAFQRAPASVVAMVGSCSVVVVALLSKWLLKTEYRPIQRAGIATAVAGLGVVSAATAIHHNLKLRQLSSSGLFGCLLTLVATLAVSLCWCLEERYLKRGYFAPVEQVGIEGCIQLLVLFLAVYPIAMLPGHDHGHVEDIGAAARLAFSGTGQGLLVGLLGGAELLSLALYNPLSQAIGAASGSVLRTLCAALRVVLVWSGGLVLFYATGGDFGEDWEPDSAPMRICGFGLLITGMAMFARAYRTAAHPSEPELADSANYASSDPDLTFGSGLRDSVSRLLDELTVGPFPHVNQSGVAPASGGWAPGDGALPVLRETAGGTSTEPLRAVTDGGTTASGSAATSSATQRLVSVTQ